MEVLLAAQIIESSKIRATFIAIVYVYREHGNRIDMSKKQLRIFCGLSEKRLNLHLSALKDHGLIEYDGKRARSIRLTCHEAHRTMAFSLPEDEQAVLDNMGLLPAYQYSRTKIVQAVKAARKEKLGDKAYTNAKRHSKRNKVDKQTELAVAELMHLYDGIRQEYNKRLRPVNVSGNGNNFSSVIPRGRRAKESKHFATFQTLLEETGHHDVDPKDWINAQFRVLEDEVYPNGLIGKYAFQRVRAAQELGLI